MKILKKSFSLSNSLIIILLILTFETSNAQWTKNYVDTLTGPYPYAPITADIDDDGDVDILVAHFTNIDTLAGEIVWYEAPTWTRHVIDDEAGVIKAIDLNNDNRVDIVAANYAAGEVVWYESPSWTRHVIDTLNYAFGIDVVDLDNDGDLDVLATGDSKTVWYEAPNWIAHIISANFPGSYGYVKAVHIDSDNDIDVFVGGDEGLVWLEAPSWTFHVIENDTVDFNGVGVEDMDNDGDLDVVIACASANQIIMYENPTWTQHIIAEFDYPWGLFLADLDNDNDVDIITTNENTSEVMWYEAPFWTRHVIDDALPDARGLYAADMNGNGAIDIVATGVFSGQIVYYESPITEIDNNISTVPEAFQLPQNYPNPFNASTTIQYALTEQTNVTIDIFDLLGRKIETLIQDEQPAGRHQAIWNANDVSTGIYFYRIQAGDYSETKKMVLLK